MLQNDKLRQLIAKVEKLSVEMDAELAKSPAEWDKVCKVIAEVGKAKGRMYNESN